MFQRVALCLGLAATLTTQAEPWPEFRGPRGDGTTPARHLPVKWSATENVVWATDLPGTGWSSPVIWDKLLWLTTAKDDGHSLRALAVDAESGRLVHDVELFRVEAVEPIHSLNSHASPTPVIERDRVYCFFGRYGAACLDSQSGKVLWKNTDLAHDHGGNGPGSSPVLHGGRLFLTCDGTVERFVTALDARTGKRLWTTRRSNGPQLDGKALELKKAYHTPSVITVDGHDELISMGAFRVSGLDPATGRELWWADIPGFSNVTRPVFAHGLLYLATGFMKPELWAIRPGGQGDVTATHVAWKVSRQAPQKPAVAVVGQEVYMISDNGILTCLDAKSGTIHYSERLGGEFSASPLVAGNRLYFFDQQGNTSVVAAGKEFRVAAKSSLGDGFMASPAVLDDTLFLRSKTKLYRVQNQSAAAR
jgi:outer membrane protein assembly factor BamB